MQMKATKRSRYELKRLIQEAVENEWRLSSRGLWLCVEEIEVSGRPPERIKVWATLHFLRSGSPFCCGEPGCHLAWFRQERINEHVRRAMGLTQHVEIEFDFYRFRAKYHDGVTFKPQDELEPHDHHYSQVEKPDDLMSS
jgi:hypothetical protein